MNSTKDVTINYERAWHRGCEDYSERVTRRQDYAGLEVGLYRKGMDLRDVLIAHYDSNSISFVYMNHRPWIQRRPVGYAVVEPRKVSDDQKEAWRSHARRPRNTCDW